MKYWGNIYHIKREKSVNQIELTDFLNIDITI